MCKFTSLKEISNGANSGPITIFTSGFIFDSLARDRNKLPNIYKTWLKEKLLNKQQE